MGRSNFMLQFMLDTSLSDAEKFPLNVQTWSLPLSIPPLHQRQWCGAPILQMSSKSYQLSDYLAIISTVQCYYKETGSPTPKQSARLTRRVVAQMKQQRLISPSTTVSCTCTRCVLTEKATATIRYWTF